MRAVLVVLALMMSVGAARAQDLMSPRAFRDAVIAQVRTLTPNAQIEVRDDASFAIKDGGVVFLDNAYNDYRRNPQNVQEIIERFARVATGAGDLPSDRGRIVMVLRHHGLVDSVRELGDEGKPIEIVWRPFAGDLIALLVFDSEEAVAYATADSLRDVGLTVEQAWSLAPTNLPARIGQLATEQVEDGIAVVSGGNGLAPSHLTEPNLCASAGAAGKIFLLLDRNSYLEVDRNAGGALETFTRLASRLIRDGEIASGTPLECRNGRMVQSDVLRNR